MPTKDELRRVAEQAERDLNSYDAKTGAHHGSANDDAGVDRRVENKFPGAEVRYDEDLSTNAGYNKRIPPNEGGETDSRGRYTHGKDFDGVGGPEEKATQRARDHGGDNDNDVPGKKVPRAAHENKDLLRQGEEAVRHNLEQPSQRHALFKGEDYYEPETVPDSTATQNEVPPDSVTQASREVDNY